MTATEQIMHETTESASVNDACMRIFEACSFQDITGQRITKVVKTLEYIESRLDNQQQALGPDLGIGESDADDRDGEAVLLTGPRLAAEGVSQDDVDALLDRSPAQPNGGGSSSQSDIDALFD